MQYKRKNKIHNDAFANHRNTPHLIEKTAIILLSYLFSGVNTICTGAYFLKTTGEVFYKYLILFGVVMLIMVPVSILDNRRKMRGKLAAILGGIMHLAICLTLSLAFSFWWIVVYGCEVLLCFLAIIIAKKRGEKR